MTSAPPSHTGWFAAAGACWFVGFGGISSTPATSWAGRSAFSWEVLVAARVHGGLSVGALWLFKQGEPVSRASAAATADASQVKDK